MDILTVNNYKTLKGEKYGFDTAILHLAPFTLSGRSVCPKASKGCASACLNTSGHGRFNNVQNARKNRTLLYFNERAVFEFRVKNDIERMIRKAAKKGRKPAIRLNGTSDLSAMAIKFALMFPDVQFYDYTKIVKTFDRELPSNYHLTFSRSETNEKECIEVLKKGFNVAVVFETLPENYLGYKVVSGDDSDLRFLDEKNVIVGLTAKGKAKHDSSGFVVRTSN